MQIRKQGKKVQLIRSTYDTTKKRSRQTVFETFLIPVDNWVNKADRYLSASQLEKLADHEKEQLTQWLDKQVTADKAKRRDEVMDTAQERIDEIIDFVKHSKPEVTWVDRLWPSVAQLLKVLKKMRRSKPPSSSVPEKDPVIVEDAEINVVTPQISRGVELIRRARMKKV